MIWQERTKEVFTEFYAPTHLHIAPWLNNLVGQHIDQGTITRVIEIACIVQGYLIGEYVVIARVEVEDTQA